MSSHLQDLAPQWFTDVRATLLGHGGHRWKLSSEALHAHGAKFRVDAGAARELQLGRPAEVELERTDTGTVGVILGWVTSLSTDGDIAHFSVAYLSILRHEPGPRSKMPEGPRIACPRDYPPLAWGDHPFYDKHRLQFHVRDFFTGGMTLAFRRQVKTPIESLPLRLTLVLPGLETLTAPVRVQHVTLRDDGEPSECAVVFEAPTPELLAGIGRYLFTTGHDVSVEALESLGYPVPEFQFASVVSLAYDEPSVREMLALRLLAYSTREGANREAIATPEQMRDRFDAHSLILAVHVGNKAVGTGRVVFNDGDPAKTEIGQFVTLPDWLWEGKFIECSRVATVPGIRKRDIFSTISRHVMRIAFQSGARYILADCEPHLLEPYKRRGSREMGLTFVHPLEGKTLHVIYSDVLAILGELEKNRQPWKALWSSVEQPSDS